MTGMSNTDELHELFLKQTKDENRGGRSLLHGQEVVQTMPL